MRSTTTQLPTSGGVRLALHEWAPEEGTGVRGCVVIVHGMAEHAARYARLASALVGAGYAVFAPDLRGHGRTATEDDLGHLDRGGWQAILDDVAVVVARARAEHPGAPVVLLGHSMGSLLARSFVADRGATIDGLVLSGTPADPGALGRAGAGVAAAQARLKGERHRSELLDQLTFGPYRKAFSPARTRSDWLSRDETEVDAYEADPACGMLVSTSFYRELLGGLRSLADPAAVASVPATLPVLVISGDADPSGNNGAAPRRVASAFREAGLHDVLLRLYPGARHEIFNETNRAEVTGELLDWLDARVPNARV